jgi:hypothetical protein
MANLHHKFNHVDSLNINGAMSKNLVDGDKNTQLFHKVANSHRKFNHVDYLNINGAMSKNPVEIQEHMVHYYNKLYFEQCSWRPGVDGQSFLSIDAN